MRRSIGLIGILALALTAFASPTFAEGRGPDGDGPPGRDGCRRQETPNLITGTTGDDRLPGTECDDIIFGLRGNDVLIGRDGEDVLVGGGGRDRINSRDDEADEVRGGRGFDICVGDDLDTYSGCNAILIG